jgi:GTPase
MEQFRDLLYERVREIHITRFPYNDFLFEIEQ